MLIYLFICLIIIVILQCKKNTSGSHENDNSALEILVKRDEKDMQTNLKYPLYCFQSMPVFNLKLPDYNSNDKEYFKYNLLNNVVLHPYRKNLLYSAVRTMAISLFRFVKKIKPTELIIMSDNIVIIDYLLKYHPIKIYLFSVKLMPVEHPLINFYDRLPEEQDFNLLRGIPFFGGVSFIHKNFNYRMVYSNVRYNGKYLTEIHKKFKPSAALYFYKTYNHNILMEVPAGQVLIAPFTRMSIQPTFLIETSTQETMKINMQDIFCRIQLFNSCSRNLNHSNSQEYLTYDMYMQKKYLPEDYVKIIGVDPVIKNNILSETLDSYYTTNLNYWDDKKIFKKSTGILKHLLVSDKTVDGSFFTGFIEEPPEELPNDFEIETENKIDKINTSVSQVLAICFENIKVSFFLKDEYDIYFYIRYLGDIYVTNDFAKKMSKFLRRTMYKQEIIENHDSKPDSIIYPYIYLPALQQGHKKFKSLIKKNYTTIWLETSCIIEFMIEFIHLLFPLAVINVIGNSSNKIYVTNYEPIENYQNLFPEPGDLIWSMKNISF